MPDLKSNALSAQLPMRAAGRRNPNMRWPMRTVPYRNMGCKRRFLAECGIPGTACAASNLSASHAIVYKSSVLKTPALDAVSPAGKHAFRHGMGRLQLS